MLQKYGRRFLFYGVGLAMGLVITKFIAKQKGAEFTYLPEGRVIKNLKTKKIVFHEKMNCYFDHADFTENQFENLFEEADLEVVFSESEAQKEPYAWYQLYADYQGKSYGFVVENQDSIIQVQSFKEKGTEYKCP